MSLNEAKYSHLRQPSDGASFGAPSSATVDRSRYGSRYRSSVDSSAAGDASDAATSSADGARYPRGNPLGGVGAVHSGGSETSGSLNRSCPRNPDRCSDTSYSPL